MKKNNLKLLLEGKDYPFKNLEKYYSFFQEKITTWEQLFSQLPCQNHQTSAPCKGVVGQKIKTNSDTNFREYDCPCFAAKRTFGDEKSLIAIPMYLHIAEEIRKAVRVDEKKVSWIDSKDLQEMLQSSTELFFHLLLSWSFHTYLKKDYYPEILKKELTLEQKNTLEILNELYHFNQLLNESPYLLLSWKKIKYNYMADKFQEGARKDAKKRIDFNKTITKHSSVILRLDDKPFQSKIQEGYLTQEVKAFETFIDDLYQRNCQLIVFSLQPLIETDRELQSDNQNKDDYDYTQELMRRKGQKAFKDNTGKWKFESFKASQAKEKSIYEILDPESHSSVQKKGNGFDAPMGANGKFDKLLELLAKGQNILEGMK